MILQALKTRFRFLPRLILKEASSRNLGIAPCGVAETSSSSDVA